MSVRGPSAAGLGLLSIPCPSCGATAGEWCQKRGPNVNQQHGRRYEAWRSAGRPVIGSDGTVITDDGPVVMT